MNLDHHIIPDYHQLICQNCITSLCSHFLKIKEIILPDVGLLLLPWQTLFVVCYLLQPWSKDSTSLKPFQLCIRTRAVKTNEIVLYIDGCIVQFWGSSILLIISTPSLDSSEAPAILKWKKSGTTRTLSSSRSGKKYWIRDREPNGHPDWAPEFLCAESQLSVQHLHPPIIGVLSVPRKILDVKINSRVLPPYKIFF